MRIITGTARGAVIAAPRGLSTRPMTERVRGAIFNILGEAVRGAAVLDLFAGSGSLGLEALSRGASRCLFVERYSEALRVLRRNIEVLGVGAQARVLAADALRVGGERLNETFDLVFVDPPYRRAERLDGEGDVAGLLRNLFAGRLAAARTVQAAECPRSFGGGLARRCVSGGNGPSPLLSQSAWVVVRTPKRAGLLSLPEGVEAPDIRRYGADCVWFVRRRSQCPSR